MRIACVSVGRDMQTVLATWSSALPACEDFSEAGLRVQDWRFRSASAAMDGSVSAPATASAGRERIAAGVLRNLRSDHLAAAHFCFCTFMPGICALKMAGRMVFSIPPLLYG